MYTQIYNCSLASVGALSPWLLKKCSWETHIYMCRPHISCFLKFMTYIPDSSSESLYNMLLHNKPCVDALYFLLRLLCYFQNLQLNLEIFSQGHHLCFIFAHTLEFAPVIFQSQSVEPHVFMSFFKIWVWSIWFVSNLVQVIHEEPASYQHCNYDNFWF